MAVALDLQSKQTAFVATADANGSLVPAANDSDFPCLWWAEFLVCRLQKKNEFIYPLLHLALQSISLTNGALSEIRLICQQLRAEFLIQWLIWLVQYHNWAEKQWMSPMINHRGGYPSLSTNFMLSVRISGWLHISINHSSWGLSREDTVWMWEMPIQISLIFITNNQTKSSQRM